MENTPLTVSVHRYYSCVTPQCPHGRAGGGGGEGRGGILTDE